jgi:hypothetical protein
MERNNFGIESGWEAVPERLEKECRILRNKLMKESARFRYCAFCLSHVEASDINMTRNGYFVLSLPIVIAFSRQDV